MHVSRVSAANGISSTSEKVVFLQETFWTACSFLVMSDPLDKQAVFSWNTDLHFLEELNDQMEAVKTIGMS